MSEALHILVVEADHFVRRTVAEMLEHRGYRVSTADSGDAMLRLLCEQHGVDAIVLDATISGNGFASLALHAKGLRLPVVMISGNPEMMLFAQERHLQLLWKPFRAGGLIDALHEALASGIYGQRDVKPALSSKRRREEWIRDT